MVTYNTSLYEFYGLSTDEKPINDKVPNACVFFEMDTLKAYMFDKENMQWVALN